MSEQAFKNVTVLKGIPVDEFMNTMGFISAATNYNCIDCHVEPKVGGRLERLRPGDSPQGDRTPNDSDGSGHQSDEFRGSARRDLLHMPSQSPRRPQDHAEIGGAVRRAARRSIPMKSRLRRQAPGAPSADQVFDKYLQAVGGAQKAAAVTSIVFKGTYEGYAEPKAPVDIYVKAPNQRTMIVHTDAGDRTTTCDGNNGWMAAPAADKPFPVITYTGGDLDGVRLDAVLSLPAGIKQAITRPVVGSTSIDDKDVVVVQGTANGGRSSIKLYFDKQSGLLVRQVRFADTIIGRVPIQVDYSDYRDVAGAGVKLPFHVITTWTDGRSDVLLTSAQTNVAIDAAKFNQPPPSAPRQKIGSTTLVAWTKKARGCESNSGTVA